MPCHHTFASLRWRAYSFAWYLCFTTASRALFRWLETFLETGWLRAVCEIGSRGGARLLIDQRGPAKRPGQDTPPSKSCGTWASLGWLCVARARRVCMSWPGSWPGRAARRRKNARGLEVSSETPRTPPSSPSFNVQQRGGGTAGLDRSIGWKGRPAIDRSSGSIGSCRSKPQSIDRAKAE